MTAALAEALRLETWPSFYYVRNISAISAHYSWVHYAAQPAPALTDRFVWLVGGLCHYLGAIFKRDRSRGPFTLLVFGRPRRVQARFAALVAHVAADTLRPARARAAGRAGGPAQKPKWLALQGWHGHIVMLTQHKLIAGCSLSP